MKRYSKISDELYYDNMDNTGDYVYNPKERKFTYIYDSFKYYKLVSKDLVNNEIKNRNLSHSRSFKDYHIDHKISLHYGFKNKIPVDVINDISNLRLIHHSENVAKGVNNFIDNKNLWILTNETN